MNDSSFRTRIRRRFSRSEGVVSLGVALVVVLVSGIALVGTGHFPGLSRLLDGGAWLRGDRGGVHVNGAAGEIDGKTAFSCEAGGRPAQCVWVQRDGQVYLVNTETGAAYRLDGSTGQLNGQPASVGPGARLLVGSGKVYALNINEGTVRSLDPESLAERGLVNLGAPAEDGMVDAAGIAFVIGKDSGKLYGVADSEMKGQTEVAPPGTGLGLGSVDDHPVLLDRRGPEVVTVRDDGSVGERVAVPGDGQRLKIGRDLPAGPVWLIEQGSGRLLSVDLATKHVEEAGRVEAGDQPDAPFVVGDRVFVKDGNRVLVFNIRTRQSEAPIDDVSEVFVKDGFLYANNPRGDGYVVGKDGRTRKIDKNKDVPETGDTENPDLPAPPVPSPSPKPDPNANGNPSTGGNNKSDDPGQNGRPGSPGNEASQPGSGPDSTTSTSAPPSNDQPPSAEPPTNTLPPPVANGPPEAPTALNAVAKDGKVDLSWTAPAGTVTDYAITVKPTVSSPPGTIGTSEANCSSDTSCAFTVDRLENGTTYEFTVSGSNSAGGGPAGPPARATPTSDVPDSPRSGTADARPDGGVDLSWSAPSGSVPIARYRVVPNDGSGPVNLSPAPESTTTQLRLSSGLTLGKRYTFTVVALGETGGTSQPSTASSTVLVAKPPSVAISSVSRGTNAATVNWTVQSNGSPLTSVEVRPNSGSTVPVSSVNATSQQVPNLSWQTTYTFVVALTYDENGTGTSKTATSSASQPVKPLPPAGTEFSGGGPSLSGSARSQQAWGGGYRVYNDCPSRGQAGSVNASWTISVPESGRYAFVIEVGDNGAWPDPSRGAQYISFNVGGNSAGADMHNAGWIGVSTVSLSAGTVSISGNNAHCDPSGYNKWVYFAGIRLVYQGP